MNALIKKHKIIVRLPNWIGDMVMATPFLHILREVFPDACITAMGNRRITDLLLHFPAIDELWTINSHKTIFSSLSLVGKLRKTRFHLGFLLTNSFGTALTLYMGKVRERIGYDLQLRHILLSRPFELTKEIVKKSMVEYYVHLLSDFTDLSRHKRKMKLYTTDEERKEAGRILRDNGWDGKSLLVGINPFAHQWITKRWLPERFAQLTARLINKHNVQCVFLSDKKDRYLFNDIKSLCSNPIIDLVGKVSLPVVPAILERYCLFISNDSGLLHVAAAMDTPLVAIFGPTDWHRTAPYTTKGIVIRKQLGHEPCMKPKCSRNFECMSRITVDEVFNAATQMLESAPNI